MSRFSLLPLVFFSFSSYFSLSSLPPESGRRSSFSLPVKLPINYLCEVLLAGSDFLNLCFFNVGGFWIVAFSKWWSRILELKLKKRQFARLPSSCRFLSFCSPSHLSRLITFHANRYRFNSINCSSWLVVCVLELTIQHREILSSVLGYCNPVLHFPYLLFLLG